MRSSRGGWVVTPIPRSVEGLIKSTHSHHAKPFRAKAQVQREREQKESPLRSSKFISFLSMALNSGLRSGLKALTSSSSSQPLLSNSVVSRGIHSTGVKRMGGHGHDEPYYLHAKHMYNLDRMKFQALKMSLAVFTAFSIGAGVPNLCRNIPAKEDCIRLSYSAVKKGWHF